jgi:glutamyl-tRNA reductase
VARASLLGFESILLASRARPEGDWFESARCDYVPLSAMHAESSDIVVTALGSGAEPLEEEQLPSARLIVDLGTPRNTSGHFATPLIDITALWNSEFGRGHGDSRRAALRAQLGEMLDRRLAALANDRESPVGSVRQRVERIRQMEVERTLRLHPDIPATALESITRSLVNQIFHLPSQRLRASTDTALAHQFAALFAPPENSEHAL